MIVVDDRSSDRTPEILARLAREDPQLRHVRIEERPADWLGKCHALATGAREATGEYLLFSDADLDAIVNQNENRRGAAAGCRLPVLRRLQQGQPKRCPTAQPELAVAYSTVE